MLTQVQSFSSHVPHRCTYGVETGGISFCTRSAVIAPAKTDAPAEDESAISSSPFRGDSLREATGIRPSLHPVTINAIAEALKIRARNVEEMPLRVTEGVEPLQVARSAGKLAVQAIGKRQTTSSQDGMQLRAVEEQTIAGRVVGVVMRFEELEASLAKKCRKAGWVAKYNEWNSFGVLEEERGKAVDRQITSDPLFCMNRAECLLALFLAEVEAPSLEDQDATVPGGSEIDFLDADRKEVLL